MTPEDFKKLDTQKKAHHLSLLYFKGHCFSHGRPSSGYFKLRSTFLKANDGDLTEMYMYLLDNGERPPLKDLWQSCRLFNESKRQNHVASDYERVDAHELL